MAEESQEVTHDEDVIGQNEAMPEQETQEEQQQGEQPERDSELQKESKSGEDDYEQRARELGWVPQDEFRGRPENHIDPKTFVQKRTDELNTIRDKNRELERSLQEMKRQLVERDKQYIERDINQIKEQRRRAVEEGDLEAFERYEKEIDNVSKQTRTYEPQPPQEPQIDPKVQVEVERFVGRNEWYTRDEALRDEAEVQYGLIERKYPSLPLEQKLRMTEDYIKQRYPQRTGAQRGVVRPPENGIRPPIKPRQTAKTYKDLDSFAKQKAQDYVRKGYFENVEEYAKEYWQN